jgi:trimethylamine:corrinoid methyltransferase-like protein
MYIQSVFKGNFHILSILTKNWKPTIKFKPLELLTEEQIDVIHRACLEVLQTTGFRIENEKVLKRCAIPRYQ